MASEQRCETCRWWDGQEGTEWGTCALTETQEDAADHPESLAHAHGNDGWQSWLSTRKDFGCVQWEEASDGE